MELLLSLYDSLPVEMKSGFKDRVKSIDDGVRTTFSCFDYNSDSDEESDDSSSVTSINSSFDTLTELGDKPTDTEDTEPLTEGVETYTDIHDSGCASGKYCR